MAAVREVAIAVGAGEPGRARRDRGPGGGDRRGGERGRRRRGCGCAADRLGDDPRPGDGAFRAAALGLPFVALVAGVPGRDAGAQEDAADAARSTGPGQPSGLDRADPGRLRVRRARRRPGRRPTRARGSCAAAAAYFAWRRRPSRPSRERRPHRARPARLLRYGAPRAPAALFAQLLFVAGPVRAGPLRAARRVGVYAAASRVSLLVVVFLTSVALVFSPFVADLYARGERERLGRLFQLLTRATFALTLPMILVLLILPEPGPAPVRGGLLDRAGRTRPCWC